MVAGFLAAAKLPVMLAIALGVALELGLGYTIRDNLFLNVWMLIYPLEVVKQWQAGA